MSAHIPFFLDIRRWWDHEGDDLADAICQEALRVNEATLERQRLVHKAYCTYGQLGPYGLSGGLAKSLGASLRLSHNAIANAVDSLVAEVTQSLAKAQVQAVGGTYDDTIRAERMTSYLEARFIDSRVDAITPQWVRDGIVAGLGIMRVYERNGKVRAERVSPMHFLVDDRGFIDVEPRTFFVRRFLDRNHAMALFPDMAEEIEKADFPDHEEHWLHDFGGSADDVKDVIRVYEAYRLPDEDGNDGMYAIAFEGGLLHSEDLTEPEPPFAFFRPVPASEGFWPEPLVMRARGIQIELNKLLARVQDAMHLHARAILLLHRKSGIPKTHLVNKMVSVLLYDGEKPSQFTPQSMPADVYRQIRQYVTDIYEVMGISELGAKSLKPKGIDSGEGLKVLNETESRRFINTKRSVDEARCDIAKSLIRRDRELSKRNSDHAIRFEEYGEPRKMSFADIVLEDDLMTVRVEPVGALGDTTAAKRDTLEEYVAQGYITFDEMADTLGADDLMRVRQLKASPTRALHKIMNKMLREETFIAPEEWQPLELGIQVATYYLNDTLSRDVSMSRRKHLIDWVSAARGMLRDSEEKAQAAAMEAQAAAMPPAPMAGPGGVPADALDEQALANAMIDGMPAPQPGTMSGAAAPVPPQL